MHYVYIIISLHHFTPSFHSIVSLTLLCVTPACFFTTRTLLPTTTHTPTHPACAPLPDTDGESVRFKKSARMGMLAKWEANQKVLADIIVIIVRLL
jgi:hypothetical protein